MLGSKEVLVKQCFFKNLKFIITLNLLSGDKKTHEIASNGRAR